MKYHSHFLFLNGDLPSNYAMLHKTSEWSHSSDQHSSHNTDLYYNGQYDRQPTLNKNKPLDDFHEWSHEKGIGSVVSHLVMEGTIDLEYSGGIQIEGCASGHYEDPFKVTMHGQNSQITFS